MRATVKTSIFLAVFLALFSFASGAPEVKLRIYLDDGTLQSGNLVKENPKSFVILSKTGRKEIPKKKIMFINGKTLKQWEDKPDKLFSTEIMPSEVPNPAFVNDKANIPELTKSAPKIEKVKPLEFREAKAKPKPKPEPKVVEKPKPKPTPKVVPVVKPKKVVKKAAVKKTKVQKVKKKKKKKVKKTQVVKVQKKIKRPRRFNRNSLSLYHYKLALKYLDQGLRGRGMQELHKATILNRRHGDSRFLLGKLYSEDGIYEQTRRIFKHPLVKRREDAKAILSSIDTTVAAQKKEKQILFAGTAAGVFAFVPLVLIWRRLRRDDKESQGIPADLLKKAEPVEEKAASVRPSKVPELVSTGPKEKEFDLSPEETSQQVESVINEVLSRAKKPPVKKASAPPPKKETPPAAPPVSPFVPDEHPLDYSPDEYLVVGKEVTKAIEEANASLAESQFDRAIRGYKTALALNERCLDAYLGLGYVGFVQEQWELALEYYRVAAQMEPASADAHYGLGRCLLELKKEGEAIQEMQTALNLDPGFDDASETLAYLGKAA